MGALFQQIRIPGFILLNHTQSDMKLVEILPAEHLASWAALSKVIRQPWQGPCIKADVVNHMLINGNCEVASASLCIFW